MLRSHRSPPGPGGGFDARYASPVLATSLIRRIFKTDVRSSQHRYVVSSEQPQAGSPDVIAPRSQRSRPSAKPCLQPQYCWPAGRDIDPADRFVVMITSTSLLPIGRVDKLANVGYDACREHLTMRDAGVVRQSAHGNAAGVRIVACGSGG